ncbi:MAG TPA: methylenetetrahydrofolate reductase [Hyphomicrobiales bacterium]|nr:methylenetetrahydrofolate reductase [Hyphomicrobiales bacterium]
MPLADLLANVSIETSPRDGDDAARLAEIVPAGCEVSITFLPGEDYRRVIEVAKRLGGLGYTPMPHISARALQSREELDDMLGRAVGEAGCDRVLVLAGDAPKPRGPFGASMDLLKTGLFARHGIRMLGFAGHPEGNVNVPTGEIRQALLDKIAFARAEGHEPTVLTQFAFEAAPIVAFAKDLADNAGGVPIHVGVAGPANPATLLKFALRCGVGNSVRVLQKRAGSIGRLLVDAGPDDLIAEIAASASGNIVGFHFFPFGGMKKTGAWLVAARRGAAASKSESRSNP